VECARLDGRFYGVTRRICIVLVALFGCGKKPEHSGPPPEVTGLAAVPSSAEVVIGGIISSASPIVEKAIEQLLARDAKLAQSWKSVREGCKIDVPKQIKHVMFALGPVPPGGRVGTGPAIMIATGSIPEADLSECVTKFVGKGGGSVTGKPIGGRTLYQVKDGARVMFFAFGRHDTVVLGNNEQTCWRRSGPQRRSITRSSRRCSSSSTSTRRCGGWGASTIGCARGWSACCLDCRRVRPRSSARSIRRPVRRS
jgi:hypothetical protein